MPKPSGKRSAALQREASKRGEPVPKTGLNEDPTMSTDPTYHPEPEEGSDEDSHAEPAMPSGTGQVTCVETLSEKRKRRHENADLIPDRASKISRTSAWRNTTGKTKKSRAQNMQKSVASLFKKAIPSFFSRTKTPVPEEEEEYDSDIEIIEVDPSISAPRSTDTAWEHVADASDTLAFEASFMCAEGTNSSLNDSTAAAPYNAEAGTQESTLSPPIVVRDSGDFATHGIPPESHGSTPRSCNTTNVPEPPASPPILPATVTENEVPATDGSPSTEGTNSSDPKLDFKTLHRDLKRAIKQHRKKLTTDLKRPSSSNTATANSIIDLAALDQYNDLRYKLSCEREDLKNRLPSQDR